MPIDVLVEILDIFQTVATGDPLSTVLFVVGNVILLFSIAFFGILVLGAVLSLFRPR